MHVDWDLIQAIVWTRRDEPCIAGFRLKNRCSPNDQGEYETAALCSYSSLDAEQMYLCDVAVYQFTTLSVGLGREIALSIPHVLRRNVFKGFVSRLGFASRFLLSTCYSAIDSGSPLKVTFVD